MARWFLLAVLALDVVFAVFLFLGGPPSVGAERQLEVESALDAAETDDGAGGSPWTRQALSRLGAQLEERSRELDRREAEIEELLRGSEVLRRAGLLPGDAEAEAAVETPATEPTGPSEEEIAGRQAFASLQQAYENMEPDSAAQALSELADRDKEAVVELLLGWRPRTSGSILDSLTQINPALAADLSYEIWKRSGKNVSSAAGSGR
jgi:flagellar motility protein MotE (MotC chaperone)